MEAELKRYLERCGSRLTKPRRLVFAALQGCDPLTMQQLVAACPGIDRASVYRTVSLYEKLGIVQRLAIGWKYKLELTDQFSRHHHHLTCLQCGAVIDFDESPQLAKDLEAVAVAHGFNIQSHQLEIQGLCNNCRRWA